jgi:RNA polymerase-binding transcription factor DksA
MASKQRSAARPAASARKGRAQAAADSTTPATQPQPSQSIPDPTEALAQKAAEVERLREFIDRTTFSGDQREASGELSAIDQHPADTADQTIQREIDYTIKGIVQDEAQQVEAAMRRQAEGSYGICKECGQDIDPERLAVRPQATLCISCQRRHEEGPHAR